MHIFLSMIRPINTTFFIILYVRPFSIVTRGVDSFFSIIRFHPVSYYSAAAFQKHKTTFFISYFHPAICSATCHFNERTTFLMEILWVLLYSISLPPVFFPMPFSSMTFSSNLQEIKTIPTQNIEISLHIPL